MDLVVSAACSHVVWIVRKQGKVWGCSIHDYLTNNGEMWCKVYKNIFLFITLFYELAKEEFCLINRTSDFIIIFLMLQSILNHKRSTLENICVWQNFWRRTLWNSWTDFQNLSRLLKFEKESRSLACDTIGLAVSLKLVKKCKTLYRNSETIFEHSIALGKRNVTFGNCAD